MSRLEVLPRSRVGVDGPWFVIAWPGNPEIRLDCRALDGVRAVELRDKGHTAAGLRFVVDEGEVEFHVADGHDAAASIAERLSAYTRLAEIRSIDSYEDAKRRLEQGAASSTSPKPERKVMLVGNDVVTVKDRCICIGDLKYRINEVEPYAQQAEDLPLRNGGWVQAAMVLLVAFIPDEEEDLGLLARRVADYEAAHRTEGSPP